MAEDEKNDEPLLIEGEYSYGRLPPLTPEEAKRLKYKYPEWMFGFMKGKTLLGTIYKHDCEKWVYQVYENVALSLAAIEEIAFILNNLEIYPPEIYPPEIYPSKVREK